MATVPLGRYLWERIHQIGVRTIQGVPGDFNLNFLDFIYDVPGLRFIGNSNELNGAYSVDGYARVKGLPGVLVTTHGVGELSALNGVAGAHSEQIKMIHVVGQTPRELQKKHALIHHAISSDPDHQIYTTMSVPARVDAAQLWDIETAPAEIDRVIRECFLQSRPVYIFLPVDLSKEHVSTSLLEKPIDFTLPVDADAQEAAAKAVLEALNAAKNPAVFVDCLTQRHNAVSETRTLVERLQLPVFASNMGKGIVDETNPLYVGCVNGMLGHPGVFDALSKADVVLLLGDLPADTNTGGFTRAIGEDRAIYVNPFDVKIKGKTYANTFIKPLLAHLTESIPSDYKPAAHVPKLPGPPTPAIKEHYAPDKIVQSWVWNRLVEFLRPHDVLISETGTCTFGLVDTKFPVGHVRWVTQTYYGSIGWATAAAMGSEVALTEMAAEKAAQSKTPVERGRTILVTGDGSFQLTIQEIGTMIKHGARPIVIVVNNEGYTIERIIHGGKMAYNDINPTNYAHLLPLFYHPEPATHFRRCTTKQELEAALQDPALADPKHLYFVEIVMDKVDVPWRLLEQIKMRGPEKVEELRQDGFIE